jgi:hypothetical protein
MAAESEGRRITDCHSAIRRASIKPAWCLTDHLNAINRSRLQDGQYVSAQDCINSATPRHPDGRTVSTDGTRRSSGSARQQENSAVDQIPHGPMSEIELSFARSKRSQTKNCVSTEPARYRQPPAAPGEPAVLLQEKSNIPIDTLEQLL